MVDSPRYFRALLPRLLAPALTKAKGPGPLGPAPYYPEYAPGELGDYQISFSASCISRGPPNPVTGTPLPISGVLNDSPNWPGEAKAVLGRK